MVDCYCSRRGSGWGTRVVVLGGRADVVVGGVVFVAVVVVGTVEVDMIAAAADLVANVVVEAVEVAFGKIAVVVFRRAADAFVIAFAPGS